MSKTKIAVAHGDGIGPEIMDATLKVLKASGANLDIQTVEIGEKMYLKGHKTGFSPDTWDILRNTDAFLKAPITTPQGGGFKSLNVTIRTAFGLYANVRPCISYSPFIKTKHPSMDVVIIRENEEDLYSGIEYRQTQDVCHSIKLISRPGTEKIVRYAFEYAKANNRKKVTCFTKDNIMKLSDGLFHKVYEEIAKEYPDIESEHWIVDIGAAKLADTPEAFDVVVLPNLYGDILSDVAAQISGSVGLAGSANIGEHGAMFEAIHGSAPRRAGQNMANPTGLILGSVLMLLHLNQLEAATKMHNALLKTIEDGVHTYDIHTDKSKQKVGTKEFAEAIIDRMGQEPSQLKKAAYTKQNKSHSHSHQSSESKETRELVGTDIYVASSKAAEEFTKKMLSCQTGDFELEMISNRGATIYPNGLKETFCIDQWRCRYFPKGKCTQKEIASLYATLTEQGIDIIKSENLYEFNGKPSYSSAKQ